MILDLMKIDDEERLTIEQILEQSWIKKIQKEIINLGEFFYEKK